MSAVFLQLRYPTPPIHPNPSEVVGVRWVPVSYFLDRSNRKARSITFDILTIRSFVPFPHVIPPLLNKLGLGAISYYAIVLHDPSADSANTEWDLWGMTLSWVNELFRACRRPLGIPSPLVARTPYVNALLAIGPRYEKQLVILAGLVATWAAVKIASNIRSKL
jgi:hypothetical protein